MPFYASGVRRSCWQFSSQIREGDFSNEELELRLLEHAAQCACPCAPCRRLREMHERLQR